MAAAARYDSPSPFSFHAADWEEWSEDVMRFRRATKLHKEDRDVQRDSLLYAMGTKQAVQIMKTFKWAVDENGDPAESDADFDILMHKFDEYFLQKPNEYFLPKRKIIFMIVLCSTLENNRKENLLKNLSER